MTTRAPSLTHAPLFRTVLLLSTLGLSSLGVAGCGEDAATSVELKVSRRNYEKITKAIHDNEDGFKTETLLKKYGYTREDWLEANRVYVFPKWALLRKFYYAKLRPRLQERYHRWLSPELRRRLRGLVGIGPSV